MTIYTKILTPPTVNNLRIATSKEVPIARWSGLHTDIVAAGKRACSIAPPTSNGVTQPSLLQSGEHGLEDRAQTESLENQSRG